jgi:hypothetical protein
MMTACARLTVLVLLLLLVCTPAAAEELTMTLDNVAVETCGTAWLEGSCVMQVIETINTDYSTEGSCRWIPKPVGLYLLGARLLIDVSALDGIEWVEVDIREASAAGRTRLFLYEAGSATEFNYAMSTYDGSVTDQTLMLDAAGFDLATIAVSGQRVVVTEVRIIGSAIVDIDTQSWSALKSRW